MQNTTEPGRLLNQVFQSDSCMRHEWLVKGFVILLLIHRRSSATKVRACWIKNRSIRSVSIAQVSKLLGTSNNSCYRLGVHVEGKILPYKTGKLAEYNDTNDITQKACSIFFWLRAFILAYVLLN